MFAFAYFAFVYFKSIEIAVGSFSLPTLLSNVFLREFTLLYAVVKVLLVGSSGLEPPTSRLSGARSNQLSYEPLLCVLCLPSFEGVVEMSGFEPLASCLQGRRSTN